MSIKIKITGLIMLLGSLAGELKAQSPSAAFDINDTIVCIGVNVSFTDMSTGGVGGIVTWNWDFGDGSVSTSQNPSHTYATGGIKTVTLTVKDAILDSSVITHNVYVIESVANQSIVRICSPASSTTISANAPISSQISAYWFSAGSAIIADPTNDTTLITNLVSGSYIFYWVLSDGFCSDADQVTIIVDDPVAVNAGPDQQVCVTTATATMAASSPSPGTGLWTTSSSATITSPTNRFTTITGLNVPGNYQFVWSVTNGSCVTRDTVIITVNNVPAVNAGVDMNTCSNPGTAVLTGNTPASGTVQWTTSTSASILSPASPSTSVSGLTTAGSYSFIYTVTNGACSNKDTVVITADQYRAANAGNDLQVCTTTGIATLNGNNPAPGTGQWSTTSSATITSPASQSTGVTGLNTPGYYYFVWSITNGTCISRDTMVIIVRAPVASNAGPDQQLCNVTSSTLAANSAAPGSGTWSTTSGATITTPSSPSSAVTNLTTGNNYFIWTITYGACVTRDTVNIHVDALYTANAGPDQQLCETTAATLAGNNPAPASGLWTTTGAAVITSPSLYNTTVTGLTTGSHLFIWTITNGSCLSRDTVVITVNATTPSNAGSDQQVCSSTGSTLLNGNTPASGTAVWSTTSSATITSPANPASSVTGLTTAGIYNFIWTITDGACISRDTVIITVYQAQAANAGPDQAFCETTTTATLAANAPAAGTGTWTTTSGATITNINNPSSSVTGLTSGSHQFVWTLSNGACTSSDTMFIVVSANDSADAGPDQQVCSQTGATNLAGNVPSFGSGAWFTTSSGTITDPADPNSAVTDLSTAGNYEFIWMISNGSCFSADTMIITVDEYIQADAGSDQQLCSVTSSQLSATGAGSATGVWISLGSATVTDPLDSASTVTDLEQGVNAFVWMVSNGLCFSTDTVNILIDSLIVADAGSDQQICSFTGIVQLNATAPSAGTAAWFTTSSAIIIDPVDPQSQVTGLTSAGLYEFIWMINNGSCLSSDTMIVTVDDSVIADAGADQQVCETAVNVQLNAMIPAAGTGVWLSLGTATVDDPLNPSSTVSGLATGTNSFVWMVSNGMCLSFDTTTIDVSTLITADAGADQQICASPGATGLAGSDPSPGTAMWSTSSSAIIADPAAMNTGISGMNSGGAYEFIYTVTNGGCQSADTLIISVDDTVIADAGPDQDLCETITSSTLAAAIPPMGIGFWTTSSSAVINDPLDPNSQVTGLVPGTNEFVWNINNGMCLNSDTVFINLHALPTTPDAGADQIICSNLDTLFLYGNMPSTGLPQWSTTGGAGILTPNDSITGVTGITAGLNSFIYTINNGGCFLTDTMQVLANPAPVADAGADQFASAMTAVAIGGIPSASGGTPPYTYLWTPGQYLNDSTISNPQATAPATMTYILQVSDSLGCTEADTMVLYINDPPLASDDSITTDEDSAVVITVLTNDTDTDNNIDSASVAVLIPPSNGTFSVDSTGSILYSPSLNFYGIDSLQYVICDTGLPVYCDSAWVFITINPVNDAPVANDDVVATMEDSCITINVLLNDTDVENNIDSLSFAILSGPANGSYTLDTIAGIVNYCPDSTFNGNDTLQYVICDFGSPVLCDTAFIIITVMPFDNTPIATADSVEICSSDSISINALINDTDVEGDTLFISIIIPPANGLAITDSAYIGYQPGILFNGWDSIQYSACQVSNPLLCDTSWIYINVHGVPQLSASSQLPFCANDSTGSIDLTVVGTGPFAFAWSNADSTEDLQNIPSGIYSVTVTDSAGCSNSFTDTLGSVIQISAGLTVQDVNCHGDSTGSIDLTYSGGTVPFIMTWTNGEISEDIDSLTAGYYAVTLTDSNGCSMILGDTVMQPASALAVSSTNIDVACASDSAGAIDITVTGGTVPYQYLWNNNAQSEDITMLVAGVYTVAINDSNGCTINYSDTVNAINPVVNVTYTVQDAYCISSSTGSIDVTATGGTGVLSYLWNTTDSTEDITGLQAGTYTLVITDSLNCITTTAITVADSSSISVTLSGPAGFCQGGDIDLSAEIYNNISYQWFNGPDSIPGATSTSITVDSSGNYYVTATYACGSVSSQVSTITVHPLPQVTVSGDASTVCDSTITITASGGINYFWTPSTGLSNPADSMPTASPQLTTLYIVAVTDSNGCMAFDSILVSVTCDSLYIPTGFSPNGDGFNDLFVITKIEDYPQNHLRIFNRWGNMVYDQLHYSNNWNGVANVNLLLKGEELPEGTYYYVLDLGEGIPATTGYIVLKR